MVVFSPTTFFFALDVIASRCSLIAHLFSKECNDEQFCILLFKLAINCLPPITFISLIIYSKVVLFFLLGA